VVTVGVGAAGSLRHTARWWRRGRFFNVDFVMGITPANLGLNGVAADESVNRLGDIEVNGETVPLLQFHQYVKGWR